MSTVINKSSLDQIREHFGLDYLRCRHDEWVTRDPDKIVAGQDFWNPTFEWGVGGKRYGVQVDLKIREERRRLSFLHWVFTGKSSYIAPRPDYVAAMTALVSFIKQTTRERNNER